MSNRLKPFASFLAAGAALVAAAALQPAGAYVLGPSSPGKWGPATLGTGATVTWSLMATGTACTELNSSNQPVSCTITALDDFMPSGYLAVVQSAFNAWASVANLTFVQVTDGGEAFDAPAGASDIRLGGHFFDGGGGVLAHGYFPPDNGLTAAGDIHFDTGDAWKLGGSGPGFDLFYVLTHEMGHALGLSHTNVPNSLMNPFYTEAYNGPQADDIAGMQALYGAPLDTPEPASLALLAGGLLGLGLVRRRRA